jgi:hypothetical protein
MSINMVCFSDKIEHTVFKINNAGRIYVEGKYWRFKIGIGYYRTMLTYDFAKVSGENSVVRNIGKIL